MHKSTGLLHEGKRGTDPQPGKGLVQGLSAGWRQGGTESHNSREREREEGRGAVEREAGRENKRGSEQIRKSGAGFISWLVRWGGCLMCWGLLVSDPGRGHTRLQN